MIVILYRTPILFRSYMPEMKTLALTSDAQCGFEY